MVLPSRPPAPPPNIGRCVYSFILLFGSAWKNKMFGVSHFSSVYLGLFSYCFLLAGLHLYLLEDFACLMGRERVCW